MVRDLRLVLLLRVLSCAAWRHVCKRRASLSLVSTLLSQSPEFPWRPLVPCHSAWLETAGYHGRMYGACWYTAQHRRMSFIGTALNGFLFINVAAIIQQVFFTACRGSDESSFRVEQPTSQVPCKSTVLILAVEG